MLPIYEKKNDMFNIFTSNNMTFPSHLHTHLELLYVEEGEIQVTIGSWTGLIKHGDYAIAFPNQIHNYYTNISTTSNRVILVICPVEMAGDFMSSLLKKHPIIPYLSKDIIHPDISYVMNALTQIQNSYENIPIFKAYVQLILARTFPEMELRLNRDRKPPSNTAQLITYLSEHFCEPIKLDDLSKMLGISKYSVSRIFNEKLLTSFSTYINTLRINQAQSLLTSSDYDILTISMMCGYENSRTFNREFKKLSSCSPREYRQRQ
jgi:AraC-like DNA-binding protein